MSSSASVEYSCSGEMPAPEIAYSWDGQGTLKLQVANSGAYETSMIPDQIAVTLVCGDAEQAVAFDSSLSDLEVTDLATGEYTVKAVAQSSSAYVTKPETEESSITMVLGGEEIASENYVAPQQGPGGPGGPGGSWDVKP